MQKINTFLRGWADYFRYGNSARHFDAISDYAARRLALLVAKRHKRSRGYGWSVLAFQSPDRLGLIDLNGTIIAPRPHPPGVARVSRMPTVKNVGEPCAGEPHARFEVAAGGKQDQSVCRAVRASRRA